jgi:hypothetical protein
MGNAGALAHEPEFAAVPSAVARLMRISGGGAQYLMPPTPSVQVVLPVQSVGTAQVRRQVEAVTAGPAHTVGGLQ